MNKIMSWISQTILLFSFLGSPLFLHAATAPKAPAGFPPFNNPDFQKELDREMAAFQKMSPAEQEAILQQEMQTLMEDETFKETLQKIEQFSQTPEGKALFEKIEKDGDISDEDLNKLMNFVEAPVVETPKQEEPQKVELPKAEPKQVITSQDQKAIAMLTDLIANTASFIIKAGQITDITNKVKRWEKKNPSFKWKKGMLWNTFTTDLDQFVSQLKMLLEKDPKNEAYLHIKALIADKSLYNNLSKTAQAMAQYEPAIEDITPSVKLSPASKKAVISAINELHETLYIINTPKEITAVMNKFEPTAKKLTDKEVAASKKADEESKKARSRGRITTAGQADDNSYYAPITYDDHNNYSSPYTPSYSSSYEPYNYGSTNTPVADAKKPSSGGSGSGSKKPAKDSDDKSSTEKSKKETAEEKEKAKTDKLLKDAEEAAKENKNPEVDNLIKDITKDVDAAAKTLTDSKIFKNFKTHLTDASQPVDSDFDQLIADVKSDLSSRKGAPDKIKTLRSKKLTPNVSKIAQDKLNALYKKHAIFDQVITDIETVMAEMNTLAPTISPLKQAAYFMKFSEDNKKELTRIKARQDEIEALATTEGREKTQEEKDEINNAQIELSHAIENPILDLLDILKTFKESITNTAKAPTSKPAAAAPKPAAAGII